ncbi:MAG: amino acid oxidase, partial [Oscillospiraceae bacterium]
DVGITVMDGPFFSIMPFGKSGYHSLTSVTFTPHITSYDKLPTFECQKNAGEYCSPAHLGNCNDCNWRPQSAWGYMSQLARKYLKDEFQFEYSHSLFSMKPILKLSEIDDSRPTLIKEFSKSPTFVSVLSGKINTVYDLEEVLCNDNK